MRVERVVVDTNVLISALPQPSGRTAEVPDIVRITGAIHLLPDETFAEPASRLVRPKFDRYMSDAVRRQFLAGLQKTGEWVAITGAVRACRDPDDDKFPETAVSGGADCLVTGDGDILALDPLEGVPILTPARFTEAVRGTTSA